MPGERPASRRFYVDSSAYLAMLLAERHAGTLRAELGGSRLLSSVLLVLETRRNLIRLSREGRITPATLQDAVERLARDIEEFRLRDLTLDLCNDMVMPIVSTPRSLDLIHLRTALWFHNEEPLTRFVSLDDVQNQGARELGLPV
jgi:hypothetical protein